jgi:nitroimidazol reductase NimA-like FMN-containing flavoprotein (pyridoxamine 5'-phosphate oxidase superfamily)
MPSDHVDHAREGHSGVLHDLEPAECWELAASRPVGRLAWQGPAGPSVVPVNFVVDGRSVRVRTAAYSALARECDDSPVAFEVDELDEEARSGWSVLMRGHAHIEYEGRAGGDKPDVWPAGPRALRLRVEVDEITGRRIVP